MPPLYGFSGFYAALYAGSSWGGDTLDFTRESSLRTISTTATVSKKKERKKRGEEIGGRLIFFFPLEEDEGERRSPRDVDESSREL